MHALDHIRGSFNKFRKLAEARENWRKTRVKLALANPGLILTMYAQCLVQLAVVALPVLTVFAVFACCCDTAPRRQ
jgi:hypothetical protein